jgi:hypothetical protein
MAASKSIIAVGILLAVPVARAQTGFYDQPYDGSSAGVSSQKFTGNSGRARRRMDNQPDSNKGSGDRLRIGNNAHHV